MGKAMSTHTGDGKNTKFIVEAGSGATMLSDAGGWDRLAFTGVEEAELSFARSGDDLVITTTGGDTVTVADHFVASIDPGTGKVSHPSAVERLILDDGTKIALKRVSLSDDGTQGDDLVLGARKHDDLAGGDGNDTIQAGRGHDTLTGGAGDDVLEGGLGRDVYVFQAGDGDDVISDAGGWRDAIELGEGTTLDDVVFGRDGDDLHIDIGNGDSILVEDHFATQYNADKDTYQRKNAIETLRFADDTEFNLRRDVEIVENGTTGDDLILGFRRADTLSGAEGNDTIRGFAGADVLDGGAGDDILEGGRGKDTYLFEAGDGSDIIREEGGWRDVIRLSDDFTADDVAFSRDGDDLIIDMGNGDAITIENHFAETLNENGKARRLEAVEQLEYANGDTVNLRRLDLETDGVEENPGFSGGLTPVVSVGVTPLPGPVAQGTDDNDVIDVAAGVGTVYGNGGNDKISADGVPLAQYGIAISVTLPEGAPSSTLAITLVGLPGDADLSAGVRNADGTWTLTPADLQSLTMTTLDADGFDFSAVVTATATDGSGLTSTTAAAVTVMPLIEPEGLNLHGGSGDDFITGSDGADNIFGEAGDDTLFAGVGDDLVFGNDGADELFGGSDASQLFGGDGDDALYGGTGANTLYGEAGNDELYSGEGDSTLFGGDDNDTIFGGSGNIQVFAGAGDDIVYGGTGVGTAFGETGADTLYAGDGTNALHGGAGDDVLFGGTATSVLNGGDGNDTLHGGTGDVTLNGNWGDDAIYAGEGANTVVGGGGSDLLVSGGGATTFVWSVDDVINADGQSVGFDVVVDFTSADAIDLSGLLGGDGGAQSARFADSDAGSVLSVDFGGEIGVKDVAVFQDVFGLDLNDLT